MNERILLIEDDEALSRMMRLQLEHAGYRVVACQTGASGLEAARESTPDIILLDILLPDMDGWAVCKQLKAITDAPIIFSTALGSEKDVVRGLDLGADDYMIKPFSYKELLARVKAALHRARRAGQSPPEQDKIYRHAHLTVNLDKRIVKINNETIALTPLEYKLLSALAEEAGHVVDHETLLQRIWGEQHQKRRQYLKLYIWYLRQKLEKDPSNPKLILTERGIGYRLAPPSPPESE